MKEGTQAIILGMSKWEPQFSECVSSCDNQTLLFDEITILDNYIPLFTAYKKVKKVLKYNRLFFISGDTILNKNDHKHIMEIYNEKEFNNIYCYKFPIYDWFLQKNIHAIRLINSRVWLDIGIRNTLREDVDVRDRAIKEGFKEISYFGKDERQEIVIGVHCKEPDVFQIFRRFFIRGVKDGHKPKIRIKLLNLFENSLNPLYQLAIDAFDFGVREKKYGDNTTHNIELDLELWKRFKEEY